jgi:hypothetical protein
MTDRIYIPKAGWYALEETPPEPGPGPGPEPIPGVTVLIKPYGYWEDRFKMQCEAILAYQVDIPADSKGLFRFYVAEYDGPATIRQLYLSATMGSFDPATAISRSEGTSAGIVYDAALIAGQRVYFNLRNYSSDIGPVCVPGTSLGTLVGLSINIG